MSKFIKWLSSLFKKKPKTDWDSFDYGKPATVEDEFSKLNAER